MKDSGWLTAVVLFSDRVCVCVCVCVSVSACVSLCVCAVDR